MVDAVFNISLGRVVQYAINVDTNTPAASVFHLHAWVITASDDDVNNQLDVDELETLASSAEVTNAGYANQVMTDADITVTVNDGTNLVDVDSSDQTYTAVVAGDVWTDITFSYDDDGSDTDTTNLLQTIHDFAVTPNGGDITAQFASAGWFQAT